MFSNICSIHTSFHAKLATLHNPLIINVFTPILPGNTHFRLKRRPPFNYNIQVSHVFKIH